MTNKEINQLLKSMDATHSGTLEHEEFISYIRRLGKEASLRLRDMLTDRYCVLSTAPGKKYIPPNVGSVVIAVCPAYGVLQDNVCGITESQVCI